MIRKIVEWFAYKLHIKERKEVDAVEAILDLLPLVFGVATIMGMMSQFESLPLPWYKRLWYWLKFKVRMARATIIGY